MYSNSCSGETAGMGTLIGVKQLLFSLLLTLLQLLSLLLLLKTVSIASDHVGSGGNFDLIVIDHIYVSLFFVSEEILLTR